MKLINNINKKIETKLINKVCKKVNTKLDNLSDFKTYLEIQKEKVKSEIEKIQGENNYEFQNQSIDEIDNIKDELA